MNIPHSKYCLEDYTVTQSVITFEKPMVSMCIDLRAKDIHHNCLKYSPDYIKHLFNFVLSVVRIFRGKQMEARVFLIEKENFVPVQLHGASKGFMLLVMIEEAAFEENFTTAAKCVLAMNNGFMRKVDALAQPFAELEKRLLKFDSINGTMIDAKSEMKPDKSSGFTILSALDRALQEYHNYRQIMPLALWKKDLAESWSSRANLLSPRYLFEESNRCCGEYAELISLGKTLQCDVTAENSECNIHSIGLLLDSLEMKQHKLLNMYRRCATFYMWDHIYRCSGGGYELNLTDRVAWDVVEDHVSKDHWFEENQLYKPPEAILKIAKKVEKGIFKDSDKDGNEDEDEDDDEDDDEAWFGPSCRSNPPQRPRRVDEVHRTQHAASEMLSAAMEKVTETPNHSNALRPTLYPALDHLKEMFHMLAKSEDANVSHLFLDKAYQGYFLGHYKSVMMDPKQEMSKAREVQNRVVPKIMKDVFPSGCLNGDSNEYGKQNCSLTRLTAGVDPYQDMFAKQLLTMATNTGVCHLSVEFFLFIISNIISFSPQKCKPIVVLDGPTGAGKSFATQALQMISNGRGELGNEFASQHEHYSTTRAHTLTSENEYETVLGQKLIEEWQSGEGGKNAFGCNTSLEAVTLKNVYDSGVTTNIRGRVAKTKQGEKWVKSVDYALDDRSAIILANGFYVCSSVKNRCTVFHIPSINVGVNQKETESVLETLDSEHIPQQFSLIRYFISEDMNRKYVRTTIKPMDKSESLDKVEMDMTLRKIEDVMTDMGFITEEILTGRKTMLIKTVAEVIAQWRAVLEVCACVPSGCRVNLPRCGQSLDEYNSYLASIMKRSLKKRGENERIRRHMTRVVVDPADILSATTLVVQLTEPDRQLMNVVCSHLVKPNLHTEMEPWNVKYLVIENTSIGLICEELKRHRTKVLDESLTKLFHRLEEKYICKDSNRLPCIRMKYEQGPYFNGRESKVFQLYVHAGYAAELYAQENKDKMTECTSYVTRCMLDIVQGKKSCEWGRNVFNGNFSNDYVRLNIPSAIVKPMTFLHHLDRERALVADSESIIRDGRHHVDVCPDFGKCRLRVLQELVAQRMLSSESPSFGDDGYMELDLTKSELYSTATRDTVGSHCSNWDKRITPVFESNQKWHAHVHIFDSRYDRDVDVAEWRQLILTRCIAKRQFATRGYFVIQSKDLREWGVDNPKSISSKLDVELNHPLPLFMRDKNRKVKVHLSVLQEIRLLEGIVDEKANLARTLVERCLCQDMTDLQTIMMFDRETVYQTQEAKDSITFINVSDVALRSPNGRLPTFECQGKVVGDDGKCEPYLASYLKRFNMKTTKNGCVTFHPKHRLRKLAAKHLMMRDEKWAEMCKPGVVIDREQLEMDIEKTAQKMDCLYMPLRGRPELLPAHESFSVDTAEGLAEEGGAVKAYKDERFFALRLNERKREVDNDSCGEVHDNKRLKTHDCT